jgi:hypothetical protein
MKKYLYTFLAATTILFLLWLIMWGDFKEFRYSKNLHCEKLKNSREIEICKSIEKNQEYSLYGHSMFSAGYRSSFTTAKKSWCDLNLNKEDLDILNKIQYDLQLAPQLSSGAWFLYNLLNTKINPNSPEAINNKGSVYSPSSSDYILKDGCLK